MADQASSSTPGTPAPSGDTSGAATSTPISNPTPSRTAKSSPPDLLIRLVLAVWAAMIRALLHPAPRKTAADIATARISPTRCRIRQYLQLARAALPRARQGHGSRRQPGHPG